jgi:hypothetical protein
MIFTAPLPVMPTPVQIKPVPASSPPQDISALPSFGASVDLPAWIVYLMFGLLGTIVLALFVILAMVKKIKRF